MAYFDPTLSYDAGGMDRGTLQNLPSALWQRVMDSFVALGGTTGRTVAQRREWIKGTDIASAATIAIPTDGNYFDVTGTTGITSITAIASGFVTLQFDGILTVTDGSNLKLEGNFVTAAGSHLLLFCDGTNWWEIARKHNAAAPGGPVRFQNSADYGKKVQQGVATGGAAGTVDQLVYVREDAVSFPSTFASTPQVVVGSTTSAQYMLGGGRSVTTTGFTLESMTNSSGATLSNLSWIGIG